MRIGSNGTMFEVPDKCPTICRYHNGAKHQEAKCDRCPIYNCIPDSDGFSLIDANDYRVDWAKTWSNWFKTDMKKEIELG